MTLSGHTNKILIVEDNPVLGKVMERSFEGFGYNCRSAGSAEEAITILQEYTPDIILSDYEMPGVNGFEFRQQLLQNPFWKDIPFVFLTSHSDEELMLKGLDLYALDYIIKGTPYSVIASKLDNIINSLHYEHERSIEELRNAAEMLHVNAMPKDAPSIPGYFIASWNKSYENYPGGDFMDFIQVDDRFTFLFLGDIMGKKWQAWFFTFGYLSYIRSAIRLCIMDNKLNCLDIMRKINKVICKDDGLKDILSSLSLLLLDRETGIVTYTGAGDLPLIHYSHATQTIHTIGSSGLLLGLQEDGYFDEQQVQLEAGDKLMAYTDGVTDALHEGHKKTNFSYLLKRITPILRAPESFINMKAGLEADFSGKRQIDDASLVFIERKNTANDY
jgi:phosphoserine phosphatase RsbU/P